jgi:hypothetical protein
MAFDGSGLTTGWLTVHVFPNKQLLTMIKDKCTRIKDNNIITGVGGGGNGLPTILEGRPELEIGLFDDGLPDGGGGGGFLCTPPANPELGLLPLLDTRRESLESSDIDPF